MKNGKLEIVVILIILALSMVNLAFAEEHCSENISLWIDAIGRDKAMLKRIDRWNAADKEAFTVLAREYDFCIPEHDLATPGEAILYCFRAAYGEDMAFWTIEQNHQYNVLNYNCGLDDTILHVLPDDNEITLEVAIDIAKSAITAEPDGTYIVNWDVADLERCQWISAQYIADRDLGKHWVISFYQLNDAAIYWGALPDQRVPTFTVFLWDSGKFPQVTYFDPYQMSLIYSYAREYHGKPFRYWNLEEKEEMYRQLLAVYEREIRREGFLPGGIINDILSHEQSLPTAEEMQPEEALALAKAEARAVGISLETIPDDRIAIYFWRDSEKTPMYHIEFYSDDGKMLYTSEMPAL